MKSTFLGLFSLVFFLIPMDSRAIEQQDWSIVSNKDRNMLTASEHIRASRKGETLTLTEAIDISSPEGLLAKYYWLLKNQKLNQLAELYTVKDGSRNKFVQALRTKKLKLDKFSTLESVRITSVQKWDDFSIYGLKLFGKNKRKMSWQEQVVCEERCYLIFSPLDSSPASELLDISKMTYLESNRVFGDLTGKIKFEKEPLEILVSHPNSGLYHGKELTLKYYLDLVRYSKFQSVERNVNCNEYKTLETSAFCLFLKETEQVDATSESTLNKYIAKASGKEEATAIAVNVNTNGLIKSILYSPKAFVSLVNKWKTIKLIGYIESDLTRFVLFQPTTISQKVLPIQAVSFAINGADKSNKLIYGSHWEDGYLFFYNNIFTNSLSRAL